MYNTEMRLLVILTYCIIYAIENDDEFIDDDAFDEVDVQHCIYK